MSGTGNGKINEMCEFDIARTQVFRSVLVFDSCICYDANVVIFGEI